MSAAIPTDSEVGAMTTAQLVASYNGLAFAAGVNPVKKFETAAVGRVRLTKVCATLRARVADAGKERSARQMTEISPALNSATVEGAKVEKPAKVDADSVERKAIAAKVFDDAPAPSAAKAAVEAALKTVGATPKKTPAAKAEKKASCAGRVREMVADGRTNAEIWAVVQPEFGLSDDKKWYPGWYRADAIRRAGKTP